MPEDKPFPIMNTDEEAERFVDTADLSTYDLSGFVPAKFEFSPKGAVVNLRMPAAMLVAVKAQAGAEGIPYTAYIRRAIEAALARPRKA